MGVYLKMADFRSVFFTQMRQKLRGAVVCQRGRTKSLDLSLASRPSSTERGGNIREKLYALMGVTIRHLLRGRRRSYYDHKARDYLV